jgi:hypothetical protein
MFYVFFKKSAIMKIQNKVAMAVLIAAGWFTTQALAQVPSRFTFINNRQEVQDGNTGLVWRSCAEGMTVSGFTCGGTPLDLTHEGALSYAASVASATGVAWRLPSIKELSSLTQKEGSGGTIDASFFPANPRSNFWSSTPYIIEPATALYVSFSQGTVSRTGRNTVHNIRLVRVALPG